MSRPSRICVAAALCLIAGCDQLGNPPQLETGPTVSDTDYGRFTTMTRSFTDETRIRRMVAEGLDELDYADSSIGPGQVLTVVSVTHRRLRVSPRAALRLVTVFQFPDRAPLARRWAAPASSRQWNAAFAMPAAPSDAITSLGP